MKKIKKMWVENRVLFVLSIIVILCCFVILGVMVSYFFGSSKSSYGDRLEGINEVKITDEVKNSFISGMKEDETITNVSFKNQGKIIYITLDFKSEVTLVEAQSKALASLMKFEQKYQDFYDFHYTLKSEKTENSEGYLIMGAKNVNGTGLVWNNNTEVKKVDE